LGANRVNRVSLGAQSFNAEKLRRLDRDHQGEDIERAVGLLRKRFENVALDLIFGVPDETEAVWSNDLAQATEIRPPHVSTYGLTIERGTQFGTLQSQGKLHTPDEEMQRTFYAAAIDRLTAAGYEQYEVSNFALSGRRCRHNETYWLGESYFAAGPGAARYVDGRREVNHRSTTTYLKRVLAGQSPVAESEMLSPGDSSRELLVFALRRLEGVDRDWFAEKTSYSLDRLVGKPLEKFVNLGMLVDDGQRVRLSREGLFVSDSIWPELLEGPRP
jgi:oxygen-independent coproporphyrinogen-3 oxidase